MKIEILRMAVWGGILLYAIAALHQHQQQRQQMRRKTTRKTHTLKTKY